MILNALYDLYDRLAADSQYLVPSPGYSPQKITFKVVLTPKGGLLGVQDAREMVDGKPRPRQLLVPGSTKPSGSGLNPCFLWDNTAYMLGYKPDDDNPERSLASFEAFRDKHLELERVVDSPGLEAVCSFLRSWNPAKASEQEVLSEIKAGFGVFQIQGRTEFVHEEKAIRSWWSQNTSSSGEVPKGQCLVTGERRALARIHDKVKGVAGAQSGGASLVGFNDSAYESYGRTQSYNAPVSEDAAFRYVYALNAIIDGPRRDKHRMVLGDTTVAFWTDKPSVVEDLFARWAGHVTPLASEAQDEDTRHKLEIFLRALRRGREAYSDLGSDAERSRFFLLGLSPNAARISVRFFHQGTVAELFDNLRRHHLDCGIERRFAEGSKHPESEFPSLQQLLDETCPRRSGRADREKIPPILAGPLLRSVITGVRYPDLLCSSIVRRIRADGDINYYRASAIKGYLNRNRSLEVSMSLDTARPDPPYRLGRLFAALEKTQQDALGRELSATIRDRFYSAASATPRSVFPRLLRTYAHHLGKLERPQRIHREQIVQEILDPIEDFPAHLDLASQGLFAIGYYHQTQALYKKKEEPKASRETPEENDQ